MQYKIYTNGIIPLVNVAQIGAGKHNVRILHICGSRHAAVHAHGHGLLFNLLL